MQTTPTTSAKPALSPVEALILERLGGARWTKKRYTTATVAAGRRRWKAIHLAVGFENSRLFTTEETSPKMRKNGVPTLGVTIHSAKNALVAWNNVTPKQRRALAEAVGASEAAIEEALHHSVCPMSTRGCRGGCVTATSFNAQRPACEPARLARTLFLLFCPADAFAVMGSQLEEAKMKNGHRGARWRVNVSDDIRWERLAPGLFKLAPRRYAYTKWSPAQRPGYEGLRLVYSASERLADLDIVAYCQQGHTVAVVFDVVKGTALPETWHGIPVVDGDETDDLFEHPLGVIVGLRVKGTKEAQAAMVRSGFARPAFPVGPPKPKRIRIPVSLAGACSMAPVCALADAA